MKRLETCLVYREPIEQIGGQSATGKLRSVLRLKFYSFFGLRMAVVVQMPDQLARDNEMEGT